MKCYVCESGWIIIGQPGEETADSIILNNASVVRSWLNGRGIGGIAKKKYKNEYTMDEIGTVEIKQNKILFDIPCEW